MINIDNKTGELQITGEITEIFDEILTVLDNLRDKINADREKYLYTTEELISSLKVLNTYGEQK